jgi:hypothetical protein
MLGQRAGLQAASLTAVSPHAGWDGIIAGLPCCWFSSHGFLRVPLILIISHSGRS